MSTPNIKLDSVEFFTRPEHHTFWFECESGSEIDFRIPVLVQDRHEGLPALFERAHENLSRLLTLTLGAAETLSREWMTKAEPMAYQPERLNSRAS